MGGKNSILVLFDEDYFDEPTKQLNESAGRRLPRTHLPDVQQVVLFAVHLVGVQHQVAVSPIKKTMPLGLHQHQLQILNPPHLRRETGNWGSQRERVHRFYYF